MGRKYIDLTGKTLNGIFIEGLDETNQGGAGKHKRWKCICPICNKEFITQSNHLLQDNIASCSTCSRLKFHDLSGQTFGKLLVLARTEEIGSGTKYYCSCECGNTCVVDGRHLKGGTVKSCGCLISSMEYKVRKILLENKIDFQAQKIFSDCCDVRPLPFDFYIPELNLLIELQGKQHFQPIEFFGGEKSFQLLKQHDAIKKEYCIQKQINFLEITYNENLEQIINEEIVWPLRKQLD